MKLCHHCHKPTECDEFDFCRVCSLLIKQRTKLEAQIKFINEKLKLRKEGD